MVHGPFVINSNLIQKLLHLGFFQDFWVENSSIQSSGNVKKGRKKHVTASQVNIFIARVVRSQPIVGCKV